MGLSELHRKIILKLGSPTPGDELIDQEAIADLMVLGLVFIDPMAGKAALTEAGRAAYDELFEGGNAGGEMD